MRYASVPDREEKRIPGSPATGQYGSLRRLRLREFALFEAVCEAGNLTVAACQLNIAQSSISRTLRSLEAAVGLPLFRRTGRGVVPTEAGLVLRRCVVGMLGDLDTAAAELAALRPNDTGEVKVLFPHYVSDVLVPPFVRGFAALFPHAALHVFEEAAAVIPERLSARSADFGLFYSSSVGAGLSSQRIARESMYLVGMASSLGQRTDPISLDEVCEMRLILSSRHTPFRHLVEQRALAAGQRLTVVRELEASQTALAFVRDGEGAVILPFSHVHNDVGKHGLVARLIEQPVIRRNVLLAFGRGPTSPLSLKASALLRSVVAAHGAEIGWLSAAS